MAEINAPLNWLDQLWLTIAVIPKNQCVWMHVKQQRKRQTAQTMCQNVSLAINFKSESESHRPLGQVQRFRQCTPLRMRNINGTCPPNLNFASLLDKHITLHASVKAQCRRNRSGSGHDAVDLVRMGTAITDGEMQNFCRTKDANNARHAPKNFSSRAVTAQSSFF